MRTVATDAGVIATRRPCDDSDANLLTPRTTTLLWNWSRAVIRSSILRMNVWIVLICRAPRVKEPRCAQPAPRNPRRIFKALDGLCPKITL